MSISLMSVVWKMSLPNPGRKLVLLALCDSANDSGVCWPSVKSLQDKCSMSERAVRDHLRGLESMGILETKERFGTSSMYQVNLDNFAQGGEKRPPADSAPTPADSAPTPADSAPHPGRFCPQTINNHKEPSINPKGVYGEGTKKPKPAKLKDSVLFDAFWSAYPKKVAKEKAKEAWNKLNPSEDLANLIISAVAAQSKSFDWTKDCGKYIPHPATWLNGKRWTDELHEQSAALVVPSRRQSAKHFGGKTEKSVNAVMDWMETLQ